MYAGVTRGKCCRNELVLAEVNRRPYSVNFKEMTDKGESQWQHLKKTAKENSVASKTEQEFTQAVRQ